jgi:hypothetical protein
MRRYVERRAEREVHQMVEQKKAEIGMWLRNVGTPAAAVVLMGIVLVAIAAQ